MKLNLDQIEHMQLFSRICHATAKDVLYEGGAITFIVAQGQVQKALGKDRANLLKLERMLKKPVRFISFHADPVKFIKNLLYPLRVASITRDDDVVVIESGDARIKGKIFGREKSNLLRMQELVKKYHGITKVVVQ